MNQFYAVLRTKENGYVNVYAAPFEGTPEGLEHARAVRHEAATDAPRWRFVVAQVTELADDPHGVLTGGQVRQAEKPAAPPEHDMATYLRNTAPAYGREVQGERPEGEQVTHQNSGGHMPNLDEAPPVGPNTPSGLSAYAGPTQVQRHDPRRPAHVATSSDGQVSVICRCQLGRAHSYTARREVVSLGTAIRHTLDAMEQAERERTALADREASLCLSELDLGEQGHPVCRQHHGHGGPHRGSHEDGFGSVRWWSAADIKDGIERVMREEPLQP